MSSVLRIEAWPSCFWICMALHLWEIGIAAQVCRRSWNLSLPGDMIFGASANRRTAG